MTLTYEELVQSYGTAAAKEIHARDIAIRELMRQLDGKISPDDWTCPNGCHRVGNIIGVDPACNLPHPPDRNP